MGQRIIYLIRHGHAAYADTEPKDRHGYLTEIGQQQAHLTAQRLAKLPIAAIHHSDLGRSLETARILAAPFPDLTPQPTPLLRECVPCLPTRGWFREISPERLQESKIQVDQALTQFFRATETEATEQHDVLVCHGNIIRYLVCCVLQVSPEAWDNTTMYNCGISEVLIKETGEMRLISHNDTGHLPHAMRTFL
jgi:serine/threonine-protein phosphatase PGAM5